MGGIVATLERMLKFNRLVFKSRNVKDFHELMFAGMAEMELDWSWRFTNDFNFVIQLGTEAIELESSLKTVNLVIDSNPVGKVWRPVFVRYNVTTLERVEISAGIPPRGLFAR